MIPVQPTIYTDFSAPLGAGWTATGSAIVGGVLVGAGTLQTVADMAADNVLIATWNTPVANNEVIVKLRQAAGDPSGVNLRVQNTIGTTASNWTTYGVDAGGGFVAATNYFNAQNKKDAITNTLTENFLATGVAVKFIGGADGLSDTRYEIALRTQSGLWVKQTTGTSNFGALVGRKAQVQIDANTALTSFGVYPSNAWLIPHTGEHVEEFTTATAGVLDFLDRNAQTGRTPLQVFNATAQEISDIAHWPIVAVEPGIDTPGMRIAAGQGGNAVWSLKRKTKTDDITVRWRYKSINATDPRLIPGCQFSFGFTPLTYYDGANLHFSVFDFSVGTPVVDMLCRNALSVEFQTQNAWYEAMYTQENGTLRYFINGLCHAEITNAPMPKWEKHVNYPDKRYGLTFLGTGRSTGYEDAAIADIILVDRARVPAGTITPAASLSIEVTPDPANPVPKFGSLHLNDLVGANTIQPLLRTFGTKKVIRTDKFSCAEMNIGAATVTCTYNAPGSNVWIDPTVIDRLVEVALESGVDGLYVGIGSTPQALGGTAPPVTGADRLTFQWGSNPFNIEVPSDNDDYIDFFKSCFYYLASVWPFDLYFASYNEPGTLFWAGTPAQLVTLLTRYYSEIVVPLQGPNPRFFCCELPGWSNDPAASAPKDYTDRILDALHALGITDAAWENLVATVHDYDSTTTTLEMFSDYVKKKCVALGRPEIIISDTEGFPASNSIINTGFITFADSSAFNTFNKGCAAWVGRLKYLQSIGAPVAIHTRSSGVSGDNGDVYNASSIIDKGTVTGNVNRIYALANLYRMLDRMDLSNAVETVESLPFGTSIFTSTPTRHCGIVASWDIEETTVNLSWPQVAGRQVKAYEVSPTNNVFGSEMVQTGVVDIDGSGEAVLTIPAESTLFLIFESTPGYEPIPDARFSLHIPQNYYDTDPLSDEIDVVCTLTNTGNRSGIVNIAVTSRSIPGSNALVARIGDWSLPDTGESKLVTLRLTADSAPRSECTMGFTATANGFTNSLEVTVYNAIADDLSLFQSLAPGLGRTVSVPVRDRAWLALATTVDAGCRVYNNGTSPVFLNVQGADPATYDLFASGELIKPGETKVFTEVNLGGDAILWAIASRLTVPGFAWKPGTANAELTVTRGE